MGLISNFSYADTSICINDYGAISGDKKDDLPAVLAAIKRAKEYNGKTKVRIFFKKGIYIFKEVGSHQFCLALINCKNIELDGNNSEVVISKADNSFISIINSENITVKNFSIDYAELPYTQGSVVNTNPQEGIFSLKIDNDFPSLSDACFNKDASIWGMLKDPETPGKLKDGVANFFFISGWKSTKDKTFQLTLSQKNKISSFSKGDRFALLARRGDLPLCKVSNANDITIKNLIGYASPAGCIAGEFNTNISIIGCKMLLKEKRLNSSNADGVHLNLCRNVRIEDCVFEGISDDGINLYGRATLVKKALSDKRFLIFKNRFFRKGDTVCLYNPREGINAGIAKVVEIKPVGGQVWFELTIGKSITEVKGNESIKQDSDSTGDHIYNLSAMSGPFIIKNCKFLNSRRHGIVLQSHDGIVEGNRMENLSDNGIICYNLPHYPEGLCAWDVLIKNNRIVNCGYDLDYLHGYKSCGAISMATFTLDHHLAKWRANRKIVIENNHIDKWRKHAISLRCAEDIIVRNNKIGKPAETNEPTTVFDLFNVVNINLNGNRINSGYTQFIVSKNSKNFQSENNITTVPPGHQETKNH